MPRLTGIGLTYKSVRQWLDLDHPITVFFGPNGAGKTNILEGIQASLTEGAGAKFIRLDEDTGRAGGAGHAHWKVQLDVQNPTDAGILGNLIQFGTTEVSPWWEASRTSVKYQVGGRVFDLGDAPAPLPDLLKKLRRRIISASRRTCSRWPELGSDYTSVLAALLFGPRPDLLYVGDGRGGAFVLWMTEIADALRVPAERLDACRDGWPDARVPFIDAAVTKLVEADVSDGAMVEAGVHIFTDASNEFRPFDVVGLDAHGPEPLRVLRRIEAYVEYRCHPGWQAWETTGGIEEGWMALGEPASWLEESPDEAGVFRFPEGIYRACRELGDRATRMAPLFVKEAYDVVVRPNPPEAWGVDGRIFVGVLEHGSEPPTSEPRPLADLGSGVAVWVAYSVLEAARQLETYWSGAEGDGLPAPPLIEGPLPKTSWNSLDRPTAFIIDEPERHLHPAAQRDAAEWIASLGPQTIVFLATHAIPFLNISSEDVGYYAVHREAGRTEVTQVGDAVLPHLRDGADRLGVSIAEIIQLTRAVLLVEGHHDELVVRHFFGPELDRNRIEILPIRGVQEALSLAELRFLDRQRIPLIAMFDNVTQAALDGGPASGYEERIVNKVKQTGARIAFVAFDEPDVVCVVPDVVVKETLRRYGPDGASTRFKGWDPIIAAHRRATTGVNFKSFVAQSLRLEPLEGQQTWQLWDTLIGQMLTTHQDAFVDLPPRPSLVRAVNEALALGASPLGLGSSETRPN